MMRAPLLAIVIAGLACSAASPLDGHLEPAAATRAAMHEPGKDLARIELLAGGELLVEGHPFVGGVERRTWIAERLANAPREPVDEDAADWLVLSPIELWVDGRTPYWRVEGLFDELTYQSVPATRLRLGVRGTAGKLGCQEDSPSARTEPDHLEADAEATWQQAIDACGALALRETEVWFQRIEQR